LQRAYLLRGREPRNLVGRGWLRVAVGHIGGGWFTIGCGSGGGSAVRLGADGHG
jgi:hypothetical protein